MGILCAARAPRLHNMRRLSGAEGNAVYCAAILIRSCNKSLLWRHRDKAHTLRVCGPNVKCIQNAIFNREMHKIFWSNHTLLVVLYAWSKLHFKSHKLQLVLSQYLKLKDLSSYCWLSYDLNTNFRRNTYKFKCVSVQSTSWEK